MKAAKTRRERLFKKNKPEFRPAVYNDIKWLWAAARRNSYEGTPEEFTRQAETILSEADKLFMLEDYNREFPSGVGPVAMVFANYDGWSLCPHVEWFPWATKKNKLRCTVGFLQAMRYTRDVGCIKIFTSVENAAWFKWLKRYVAISLVGKVPNGRASGDEYIFYLRGRKNDGRTIRRRREIESSTTDNIRAATGSIA